MCIRDRFKTLVEKYPNSPEAEDALDNVKTIYVEDGKPGEYANFMRQAGRPPSVSTEDSLTYAAAEKQYDDQKINEALNSFNAYLQQFPNGTYALDANFNRAEIYYTRKDWNLSLIHISLYTSWWNSILCCRGISFSVVLMVSKSS